MARIAPVEIGSTPGKTHEILSQIQKLLGTTPNLFRVAARAPSVLEGMFALTGTVSKGTLPAATREAIALTVAEQNGCDYCLSAHAVLGRGAGLSDDAIERARNASSSDAKTQALLRLARAVVIGHGRIPETDVALLSEEEALEVVANVVLNIFTNYVNLVAQTEIDFPVVRARKDKAA